MRIVLAGLTALYFYGAAAGFAQDSVGPASDATQWTMSPDGSRHDASSTNCINDVVGFAPMVFANGDGANLLGVCSYSDATGTGDAGLRVRRYAAGEGESREAIANDRTLMEPDPQTGAPLFTVRMAPATTRDGVKGGRVTITKVKNGYLVDCYAEGVNLEAASAKLARICSN